MKIKAIDEAIARKLGWTYDYYPESGRSPLLKFWFRPGHRSPDNLPRYSTDIKAAWEILETFKQQPYLTKFEGLWYCDVGEVRGKAETAPLAICRAFLALEEKQSMETDDVSR